MALCRKTTETMPVELEENMTLVDSVQKIELKGEVNSIVDTELGESVLSSSHILGPTL